MHKDFRVPQVHRELKVVEVLKGLRVLKELGVQQALVVQGDPKVLRVLKGQLV